MLRHLSHTLFTQPTNYQRYIKIVLLLQISFPFVQTQKVRTIILMMTVCTLPNFSQSFIYIISRQNSDHRFKFY